jgi:hypothetical protein
MIKVPIRVNREYKHHLEEDIHPSDRELGRRRRIFARTAIHQGRDGLPEAADCWHEPPIFFGLA